MLLETTIHTIRHAHTQYNSEKRYAGTIDVPLSERGIREGREAAAKLANVSIDLIISSKLKRSVETARLLGNGKIRIVQSELCNERNFGVLEGLTWEEVQNITPPVLFIKVGNDLHSVNPKGGEPFEDLWERAKAFKRYIFDEFKGLKLLVVSHGVFLQMFHGVLSGSTCIESLAKYPSNLELNTFRFSDDRLVGQEVAGLLKGTELRW